MTFISVRELFLKVKKETVQMFFEDLRDAKLNYKLIKSD